MAPARTRAGAETTRPVGRTKPIHSRWAATQGLSWHRAWNRAIWNRPSVGLRPEVDEADGLDAAGADLVEGADPLVARARGRGRTARGARARSGCRIRSCRFSSSSKSEGELLESSLGLSKLLADSRRAGAREPRAALSLLVSPRRRSLAIAKSCQLFGARLQLGQEFLDIAGGRVEELALDDRAERAVRRIDESPFEKIEGLLLGLPRVGPERPLALGRSRPSGRRAERAPHAGAQLSGRRARAGRAG